MNEELRGFDADDHYEALDAFTRHMGPAFAKRCMQRVLRDNAGALVLPAA